MTKLSNYIKLNLEMAKKLNINPTQEPEDKILEEKTKGKAAF